MSTDGEVIARLERLERENRRLERIGAVGLILIGALVVMAQAPARPRVLEAEKLIIRYPNGKEGIVLEARDDGSGAAAIIKHPNGVEGITLEATGPHGSGAYFFPDANSGEAWITAKATGSGVHIKSPQDKVRMELNAGTEVGSSDDYAEFDGTIAGTPSGPPYTSWLAARNLYRLEINTKGEVFQRLDNNNLANRAILELRNDPSGAAVSLWDDLDTTRAILGNTSLVTTRTGSVEKRPLSSLVLFDKDGKVLWNAP